MNTMVRMTPITSQTMMVRMVLFTGYFLPRGKTPGSQGDGQGMQKQSSGREPGFSRGRRRYFQPPRQQVLLGALAARCVGFPHRDFHERRAQRLEVFIIPRALEDLDE